MGNQREPAGFGRWKPAGTVPGCPAADVATDVVTGKIARRLREHPTGLSPWCDREGNLVQNLLRQAAQIFHLSP